MAAAVYNAKTNCMIIDSIQNAHRYESLHPFFAKAFAHIRETDWAAAAIGKYDISGEDLKAIVSEKQGMTEAESTAKFECHNKHIDIQFCISGIEEMGWKPRPSCVSPKGEYNPEKDVLFFNDQPDMFFTLHDGQFAIFFPEDVHAPMIGEGVIKKLVIKVKI